MLRNAANVLRLFGAERTGVTVTEVTTLLDMPKANASRLLKAMRDAGMLETIGDTRRHRPGRLMLDLAVAYRHSSSLIELGGDIVADLTQRFGHTGYVSLREGREVTAVADYPGTNALRVVSNIGRRLPAESSATGRALLARLDDAGIRELYAGRPEAETDALITRIARVRNAGYAFSSQESTAGVDAIALAVADPGTDETVSLCLVYPHAVVDRDDVAAMLQAMSAGAARLARALGDNAFRTPDIPATGPIQ